MLGRGRMSHRADEAICGNKNQRKQVGLLVFVSVVLICALGILMAVRTSASLSGARRSDVAAFPNYDAEAIGVCVVLLALGFLAYFVFGRDRKPIFTSSYCCDPADFEMPPAVLGRLMRANAHEADDVTASVLHLAQAEVVRVERGVRQNAVGAEIADYVLTRDESVDASRLGAVERATLSLLFEVAGEGASSVWLGDVHSFSRREFNFFTEVAASWQTTLSEEVVRYGLFDAWSNRVKAVMVVCSGVFAVSGIMLLLATRSVIPLLSMLALAAAYAALALRMPRLTQCGVDAMARAEAFRRWLAELNAAEVSQKNAAEWARVMPYAFVLGLASDTIDVLLAENEDWSRILHHATATTQACQPELTSDSGCVADDGAQLGQGLRSELPSGSGCVAGNSENENLTRLLWYSESLSSDSQHFARAASNCITSAVFASSATEATARIGSLNSPVQGALSGGGIPAVGGVDGGAVLSSSGMR